MVPLLLVAVTSLAAPSSPGALLVPQDRILRACTQRGALVGAVLADGSLWASLGDGSTLVGTEAEARVYTLGGAELQAALAKDDPPLPTWTGPLSTLAPVDLERWPLEAWSGAERIPEGDLGHPDRIADHLLRTATLVECPPGGPGRFWVGPWPVALALTEGAEVVDANAWGTVVRSPRGVAVYGALAAPRSRAEALATELAEAYPRARAEVVWTGTPRPLLQYVVSSDPQQGLPETATLSPGPRAAVPLLPHLDLPAQPLGPGEAATGEAPDWPVHLRGRELVHVLNAARTASGLPALAPSRDLDLVALGHCSWLDHDFQAGGAGRGHVQDPASPVFTGSRPGDRGADSEVVVRQERLVHQAVAGWLSTPFHRIGPLHPQVDRAGGCATRRGARVMNLGLDRSRSAPPLQLWPPDGAEGVPVSFHGRESPDPLPASIAPGKTLPVGYTLSAWSEARAEAVDLVESWLRGPEGPVDHYVIHPDNHPDLAGSPTGTVHLMAKEPLAFDTAYTWGLRLRVDGALQTAEARLRTRPDPRGTHPAPSALGRQVFAATNAARAARGLPPVAWSAQAALLAELRSVTQGYEDLRPVTPSGPIFAFCREEARMAELLSDPRHAGWLDRQLRHTLDPRTNAMGEAVVDGQHCLAWFDEALVPQPAG